MLSTSKQLGVDNINASVDLKIIELSHIVSKFKNHYLHTGEERSFASASFLVETISDLQKHRLWQDKELNREGAQYLFAYTNALKQMLIDCDVFKEHYRQLAESYELRIVL